MLAALGASAVFDKATKIGDVNLAIASAVGNRTSTAASSHGSKLSRAKADNTLTGISSLLSPIVVLAQANRFEEAVALLDYINYASGTAVDRSDREATLAYIFGSTGRSEEAAFARSKALSLYKIPRAPLNTLAVSEAIRPPACVSDN